MPPITRRQAAKAEFTAAGSIRLLFSVPKPSAMGPALFLDRDGVINQRVVGGYVTNWSAFHFVPGITEALRSLSSLALPLVVVSNQAAVDKGLLTVGTLAGITRRFVEALRKEGAMVDAAYYCPHTPAADCPCRKPKPGLLEQAARDWGLDLGRSILIGDSPADAAAAMAVGCNAITLSDSPQFAAGEASGSVLLSRPAQIFPEVVRLLGIPRQT